MSEWKQTDISETLREFALIDECEGGNPLVIATEREAADLIDRLAETLETAMAFIHSHVADPDLTPEMWGHYRRLDHMEPMEALKLAYPTNPIR